MLTFPKNVQALRPSNMNFILTNHELGLGQKDGRTFSAQNTRIMAQIYVHSHHGNEVFELQNGNGTEVSIVYNPVLGTLRLTSHGEQRMFILEEEESLLQKKLILKNEYGVKIGQMGNEKWHVGRGHIDIEQERFFYKWHNTPGKELTIYQDSLSNPLLRSTLNADQGSALQRHSGAMQCLLMGICWHLFLPISREHSLSHAV